MGVNIVRASRVLKIMKDYGYVEDSLVDVIIREILVEGSKCFKYIDKYDNTFFNSKQWSQLKKEIDTLKSNPNIPNEIVIALYDCLDEVKGLPDQYFGFIGD